VITKVTGYQKKKESSEEGEEEGSYDDDPHKKLTEVTSPQGVILKSGFLSKKGVKRRNWNKRWFVLRNATLSYYKNINDKTPKGVINIREIRSVESSFRKPFCFAINTRDREYFINANDSAEQADWMRTLTEMVSNIPIYVT